MCVDHLSAVSSGTAPAAVAATPTVVEQSVSAVPPQTKPVRHIARSAEFKLPGVSVPVFIRSLESFEDFSLDSLEMACDQAGAVLDLVSGRGRGHHLDETLVRYDPNSQRPSSLEPELYTTP